MALSVSPAWRDRLTSLLICFSLGNIVFLRRWYDLEHLHVRAMDYYRTAPPQPTLLIATLGAASIVALACWAAWLWVQRNPTRARVNFARCAFLLTLIYSLESFRRYWDAQNGPFLIAPILIGLQILLAAGIVQCVRGRTRILYAARRCMLLLMLMLAGVMIDFTSSRLRAEPPSAYQPKPPLPMLASRASAGRRVIWIVFDELDQRLAFDLRHPSVNLPELDRLRAESLVANHAQQTAHWTTIALPSLLSGRIYTNTEPENADTLLVYPSDSGPAANWRDEPNVFKRARAMRFNAALVGWHHPYCRVLGDSVVHCLSLPSGVATDSLIRETSARDQGVLRAIPFLIKLQWDSLIDLFRVTGDSSVDIAWDEFGQRRQQKQYFQIRNAAYTEAVDRQIDLLFVHFPVPHFFGIYNRKRRDFSLNPSLGYADNLALVDRTVGELRRKLEQAGLWNSTTLLITSDHGLRPKIWRGRLGWTPRLDRLTSAGQSHSVPFIVKFAGQNRGIVYDKTFSNVISGDLCLAILSGQVLNGAEATAWLDQRVGNELRAEIR